jgi:hypothetical protein
MAGPGDTWVLRGEGLVAFARCGGLPLTLPDGVVRMPGPGLVSALRYTDSTVGPFLELSIAVPARVRGRLGWCRTLVVVDRPEVRTAVRAHWGLPASVGTLRWFARDDERELVWEERDLVVRGRGRGPVFPWATPQPLFLERHHEPVVAPGRMHGTLKLARVRVQVFPGDELAPLAGGHPGAVLRGLHHARGPVTVVRTGHLLAPRPATGSPEPVMANQCSELVH